MHRFEKEDLKAAPPGTFRTQLPVRFQDVDAAGIVFFARIFDYVHAAYEEFLASVGHPLPTILAQGKWAAPLRHAEADYLAPSRFGDVLTIELVRAHVVETEIALGWRLTSDAGPSPRAVVQTVHAFVTLPRFERCAVPPDIVQALTQ